MVQPRDICNCPCWWPHWHFCTTLQIRIPHTGTYCILRASFSNTFSNTFIPLQFQVATLTIKFLLETLKSIDQELWSEIYLSYDNMLVNLGFFCKKWQIINFYFIFRCNLDRLKLLRDKLPLDGKYSEVWLGVNKLIDPLHLKNHKVLLIMISIKF